MARELKTREVKINSYVYLEEADNFGQYIIDLRTATRQDILSSKFWQQDIEPAIDEALKAAIHEERSRPAWRKDNTELLERLKPSSCFTCIQNESYSYCRMRFKSKNKVSISYLNKEDKGKGVETGDTVIIKWRPKVWAYAPKNSAGITLEIVAVQLTKKGKAEKTKATQPKLKKTSNTGYIDFSF